MQKKIEEIIKHKASNFYSTYINKLSTNINNNNNNLTNNYNNTTNNYNNLTNNYNNLTNNKYISIVKKFNEYSISNLAEQALADDEDEFEEVVDELKLLN